MLRLTIVCVCWYTLAAATGGPKETGRAIEFDATVAGSPEAVCSFWLDAEHLKQFFAPGCRVEPRVGGRYEIIFQPDIDPEGRSFGTFGAKLRNLELGKRLVFEWKGPPWATEMNVQPFPTSVEITFEPDPSDASRTHVHLPHRGFGPGGNWDRAFEHFQSAWRQVLDQLTSYGAKVAKPVPPPNSQRVLKKEVTVAATPQQVWAAWTTPAGLAAFFAPQANIDLRIGGAYELYIKPDAPEGERGCEGCTILTFVPLEMLSVTWNAPPSIPSLRKAGARTQVTLYFTPVDDGHVHVEFTMCGFGAGEDWDRYYAYFDRAFSNVLLSLNENIAKLATATPDESADRILRQDLTVEAPLDRVWDRFTTKPGIESWMAKHAEIDLRRGGLLRANYNDDPKPDDGTWIVHEFLNVDPQRMLSTHLLRCPDGFPYPNAIKNMWSVMRFEPVSESSTRISLIGLGYGDDPESREMYAFFEKGNAFLLDKLRSLFSPPPADRTASIADLAWFAGTWVGELAGGQFEETWSPPVNGMMMGMFRLQKGGKTTLLEFAAFAETENGIELYFRHFSPTLVAFEEKDSPTTLRLVKHSDTKFEFANPFHLRPKTLTIERRGTDGYFSRAEIIQANGETKLLDVAGRRHR